MICITVGASWHCKRCVDQRYKVAAAENRALKRSDLFRFKGGQQRRQQQELTPPCDVSNKKQMSSHLWLVKISRDYYFPHVCLLHLLHRFQERLYSCLPVTSSIFFYPNYLFSSPNHTSTPFCFSCCVCQQENTSSVTPQYSLSRYVQSL